MLGFNELFIISIIILFIFGPEKLPKIGKIIGASIGEFQKAQRMMEISNNFQLDIFKNENDLITKRKEELNNLIIQVSKKLDIDIKDKCNNEILIIILKKIIEK